MLAGMFGADAWQPRRVFRGAPGCAFDFATRALLYQDSARTTLVNAAGDPIGSATDLSGYGNHASMATATRRPLSGDGYALLDGSDDALVTPVIDFSGTSKVTIIASVRKLSDAAAGYVVNHNSTGFNAFTLAAPNGTGPNYSGIATGDTASRSVTKSTFAAPHTAVITALLDIAATGTSQLRINGELVDSNSAATTGGSFVAAALHVGQRSTGIRPFNGWISRLLVVGRWLTPAEYLPGERWAARPLGVVLP